MIENVGNYLKLGRFVVSTYQRGYKWSLLPCATGKTHLQQILRDLIQAFEANMGDYHLQGVTVKKRAEHYELIDGQQRTTSLYLILLWGRSQGMKIENELLVLDDQFRLDYQVRRSVQTWIADKYNGTEPQSNPEIQDIAAMQAAWEQIHAELSPRGDLQEFINYLLDHVQLIVLTINDALLPPQVFSMMNKDKAIMTKTDLIKARLLSEVSRLGADKTDEANEIRVAQRRNQLAHEWDRWRLWWEDKAHAEFFGRALTHPSGEPPMAALLRWFAGDLVSGDTDKLYAWFEEKLAKEPQSVYDDLHERQEILQEWYEIPEIHNAIGLLLFGSVGNEKQKLLELFKYYQEHCRKDFIKYASTFANWSLIIGDSEGEKSARAKATLKRLMAEDVYNDAKDDAYRQLLRMNIELLPACGRFPFLSYQKYGRSLEHIQPKSRVITRGAEVYATEEAMNAEAIEEGQIEAKRADGFLDFRKAAPGISEHCIGNLVLLSAPDNSAVGTKGLYDKRRKIFFRLSDGVLLLHTLKVVAKTHSDEGSSADWTIADIKKNKEAFEQEFRSCYGLPKEVEA